MNRNNPTGLSNLVLYSLLAMALASCGGQQDSGESSQDFRFKAQARAFNNEPAPTSAPAELSAAERAELQARSREWATVSLLGPRNHFATSAILATGNGATLPPLHFGRAFTLQAAAQGETLAELQAATPPPATAAVAAALQGGLQRTISAGEVAMLTPTFLDRVTARPWPHTLGSVTLQPLTAAQLQTRAVQLNHRLVASVEDRAAAVLPWPQVSSRRAAWNSQVHGWLDVAMLRIQAPTLHLAGPAWTGQAMQLAGGHWLLKIEQQAPAASSGADSGANHLAASEVAWTPAELSSALASATTTLMQAQTASLVDTPWDLPEMAFRGNSEMNDNGGMDLAQNERNANLRGLDGGGTFARLFAKSSGGYAAEVSVSISAAGLGYSGGQGMDFIFSPLNLFGPGFYSSGAVGVTGTFWQPPPPCPSATVILRPFFLALLQANGNLALLSRQGSFSGSRCVKL